jgi:hypothetical protein
MIAAILIISLLAVGCSRAESGAAPSAAPAPYRSDMGMGGGFSAAQEEQGYALDMASSAEVMPAPAKDGVLPIEPPVGGVAVNPDESNRKIVYTADVGLQTKEFEAGLLWIKELTQRYQGFIQSSSIQGRNLYEWDGRQGARSAHFTLRIPESGMQSLLDELETQFNVNHTNIYSDDITAAFFDTQARLDSLRVQQERLLEMLGQAENVEYLLEVQKELARVGYEIESLTTTLNRMKDSVAYSTVNLYIEEVVEYTAPQTIHTPFSERVSNAFSNAWKDFVTFCQDVVLWLVSAIPFLLILLPIALLVVLVVRRGKKEGEKHPARRLASLRKQPGVQEEQSTQEDSQSGE